MRKIKLGYFAQYDIRVSTTFIYDLMKGLKGEDDIDVEFYNGGLNKNATLNSNSIGYSSKNLKWIHRSSRFSFLFGKSKQEFQLKAKQDQASKLLEKKVDKDIDAAYVDYATTGVVLMEYFNKHKIPFAVHVHGYDITMQVNDTAYKKQLSRLFELADKFIAPSYYMKRRLVLLGCPDEKVDIVRYGVEDSRVEITPWEIKKSNPPSVVFLGRLTPKKSPMALIQAFNIALKEVPSAKLSIIGDGPLRNEVEALIKKLDLSSSIKLFGALNRDESFPILKEHWIYAQHSVTPVSGDTEGYPISLAEAAVHELPIVSTIHNGITENVVDGETGYLVPEYDYDMMADRLIELLKNPDLAETMGKNARQRILKINNLEERVSKIKSILVGLPLKTS